MKIGIGMIKGTFTGKVKISDRNEPSSYRMRVEGKGPQARSPRRHARTDRGRRRHAGQGSGDANVRGTLPGSAAAIQPAASTIVGQFFKCLNSALPPSRHSTVHPIRRRCTGLARIAVEATTIPVPDQGQWRVSHHRCRACTLPCTCCEKIRLTGTHTGCRLASGACTVLLDGRAVKSCMVLAAQVEGRR